MAQNPEFPPPDELSRWLGGIDIYLLDQVMKGRFTPGMAVLDAGCGQGRNIAYLMGAGLNVCGVDSSSANIAVVRRMAAGLAPHLPQDNFRIESVESMSFEDVRFDAVISNAVLHFAHGAAQFEAMLREMWRVLQPGGFLFARLGSTIGIEGRVRSLGGHRYAVPDGSQRFLVDEAMLLDWTERLSGRLLEPIKTVNVQGQRCMTTWCVKRMV